MAQLWMCLRFTFPNAHSDSFYIPSSATVSEKIILLFKANFLLLYPWTKYKVLSLHFLFPPIWTFPLQSCERIRQGTKPISEIRVGDYFASRPKQLSRCLMSRGAVTSVVRILNLEGYKNWKWGMRFPLRSLGLQRGVLMACRSTVDFLDISGFGAADSFTGFSEANLLRKNANVHRDAITVKLIFY